MTWRKSFAQATDIRDLVAHEHRLYRHMLVLKVFAALFIAAAVIVVSIPFMLQLGRSNELSSQSSLLRTQTSAWPEAKRALYLNAAQEYNTELARSGQEILGDVVDPFTDAGGHDVTLESKDARYQSLLNIGGGMMGSVEIPKIGVNLPIYHGTSQRVLESGAGHLYGTSLPVGGPSTHAVITGHRGMVSAAMFTRLDEMRNGDFFYIDVLGETLAYQVDSITVIDPTDMKPMLIVPGQDRVTLMTCTPYGVNTQRLLVSGHRVPMPAAPAPSQIHDALMIGILAGVATLAAGLVACTLWEKRHGQVGQICHARVR